MAGLIQRLAGFIKFSHTVFALPFALASMLVAARDHRGWPGFRVFLLVLVAVVAARTCAMAFNRIVDRRFDALNPRTARRHLPTGEIGLPLAVLLCLAGGAGLIGASWALNPVCLALSPAALFFSSSTPSPSASPTSPTCGSESPWLSRPWEPGSP